jgi:hypothetical protein
MSQRNKSLKEGLLKEQRIRAWVQQKRQKIQHLDCRKAEKSNEFQQKNTPIFSAQKNKEIEIREERYSVCVCVCERERQRAAFKS